MKANCSLSEDTRITAGWKSEDPKEMSRSCGRAQGRAHTPTKPLLQREQIKPISLSLMNSSTLNHHALLLRRRPSTLATCFFYFPFSGPVAILSGWNMTGNCSDGVSQCVARWLKMEEKKPRNLDDDQSPLVSFSGNVSSFLCDNYLFRNHYVKEIINRIYSDSVFAFVCFLFLFFVFLVQNVY